MSDDRPNALLTSTERKLLWGEAGFSADDSRGRSTRTRLRERVCAGVDDVGLLADPEGLEARDAEQIRERLGETGRSRARLAELVALVYRLDPIQFESIVELGVSQGVRRFTPEKELREVSIRIAEPDWRLEEARRQMEAGNPLTDRQVRVLLESTDTSAEDLQDYVQAHPSERPEEYFR